MVQPDLNKMTIIFFGIESLHFKDEDDEEQEEEIERRAEELIAHIIMKKPFCGRNWSI